MSLKTRVTTTTTANLKSNQPFLNKCLKQMFINHKQLSSSALELKIVKLLLSLSIAIVWLYCCCCCCLSEIRLRSQLFVEANSWSNFGFELTRNQLDLSRYDNQIQSSSLGEPVFRLEPQAIVSFASSRGIILPCLASGIPEPKISWFSGQQLDQSSGSLLELGQLVTNVTNLRQISSNGRYLRLMPFKNNQFQADIHATEYRCIASNSHGTIHSKSVQVQAGKFQFQFVCVCLIYIYKFIYTIICTSFL